MTVSTPPESPVLFIFLDGFGLGKSEECNPLFTHGLHSFEKILGCRIVSGNSRDSDHILFRPVDACLDVEGIPQSATGQTSLLTGINAQKHLGYHLCAFPNRELIGIINKYSIMKRLSDIGLRSTFANAYTDTYFEKAARRNFTHSVTTNCMLSANLPFRMIKDLLNNNAVYWDITREHLSSIAGIEKISGYEAGKHLSVICRDYEFTLFECFATDNTGHKKSMTDSCALLDTIDEMLCGCIDEMPQNATLVICSDHGNIEDLSTSSHTVNKVPLIAIGPKAPFFRNVERIDEITPAIMSILSNHET